MKAKLALPLAALSLLGTPLLAADATCDDVIARTTATAERAGSADPIELLQLVDQEVSAHPDCACEIVKAAIEGTGSDEAIVGYIVETAVRAAPQHMRLIGQCAIATAPDSLTRVQEVLARLDPSAGTSAESAKSSKSKDVEVKPAAQIPNPLDYPVIVIPPVPPVINPPPATTTDF